MNAAEQAASIDYAEGRTRYWAERAERVREFSTTLFHQYLEIAEVWKGIASELRKSPQEPPPDNSKPREDHMDDDPFEETIMPLFEEYRAEWLSEARAIAERLGEGGRLVTINDVRYHCPPPAGLDPRVMGAVLRRPRWELVGYVKSGRATCHGRPVGQFRRAQTPAVG